MYITFCLVTGFFHLLAIVNNVAKILVNISESLFLVTVNKELGNPEPLPPGETQGWFL